MHLKHFPNLRGKVGGGRGTGGGGGKQGRGGNTGGSGGGNAGGNNGGKPNGCKRELCSIIIFFFNIKALKGFSSSINFGRKLLTMTLLN